VVLVEFQFLGIAAEKVKVLDGGECGRPTRRTDDTAVAGGEEPEPQGELLMVLTFPGEVALEVAGVYMGVFEGLNVLDVDGLLLNIGEVLYGQIVDVAPLLYFGTEGDGGHQMLKLGTNGVFEGPTLLKFLRPVFLAESPQQSDCFNFGISDVDGQIVVIVIDDGLLIELEADMRDQFDHLSRHQFDEH
jgi:hypothetical protein